MSDAASTPNPNAAEGPHAGSARPPLSECGKESLNRLVERTRHTIGGVRLTVEKCPDANRTRAIRGAAMVGGAGALGTFLLRRNPVFSLLAGLGGAVAGALGSRYHVAFDWDPDRAFGGETRGEVS
jgi:hypothetical protein